MDAVEFFKTVNRLCKNQSGCAKCPIWEKGMCMARFGDYSVKNIEETISKVEQWAKDHPVKTRKSEFRNPCGLRQNGKTGTITTAMTLSGFALSAKMTLYCVEEPRKNTATDTARTVAQGW